MKIDAMSKDTSICFVLLNVSGEKDRRIFALRSFEAQSGSELVSIIRHHVIKIPGAIQ